MWDESTLGFEQRDSLGQSTPATLTLGIFFLGVEIVERTFLEKYDSWKDKVRLGYVERPIREYGRIWTFVFVERFVESA